MKEEIKKLINGYWRFNDYQHPMSSYHEKQELLKEIDKLSSHYISKDKVMEIAERSYEEGFRNYGYVKEGFEKFEENVLKKEYGL